MATQQTRAGQLKKWLRIYWAGVGRIAERRLMPSRPRWLEEIEDYLREQSMGRER